MIPAVLCVVLGITAVAALYRRAWTISAMAGVLALGAMYVATGPNTTPAHIVHQEQP